MKTRTQALTALGVAAALAATYATTTLTSANAASNARADTKQVHVKVFAPSDVRCVAPTGQ